MKRCIALVFAGLLLSGMALSPTAPQAATQSPFYIGSGGGVLFSNDGKTTGALEQLEDFGASPYFSLRVGYRPTWKRFHLEFELANAFKYDLNVRRSPPEGGSKFVLRPKRHGAAYSAWLWTYVNLEELRWKRVRPFIGVGGGVTYFDSYPTDGPRIGAGVTAGVAIALTENFILDVAFRHVRLSIGSGRVKHGHNGVFFGVSQPFG